MRNSVKYYFGFVWTTKEIVDNDGLLIVKDGEDSKCLGFYFSKYFYDVYMFNENNISTAV